MFTALQPCLRCPGLQTLLGLRSRRVLVFIVSSLRTLVHSLTILQKNGASTNMQSVCHSGINCWLYSVFIIHASLVNNTDAEPDAYLTVADGYMKIPSKKKQLLQNEYFWV